MPWRNPVTIMRAPHHGVLGTSTASALASRSPWGAVESNRLSAVRVRRLVPSTDPRQRDIVSQVAALRDLVEKGHISAARQMLNVLSMATLEEPAIERLRRALTPPTVRRSIRRDPARPVAYAWLRQHGHEYQGQWVAIAENGLIAAAPTLKQLRKQLPALGPSEQPLIHKL